MSLATRMPHTENGITVNFPDENYFQFEGNPAYRRLAGSGVCEMDFGWYDVQKNILYLIEIKNFFNPAIPGFKIKDLNDGDNLDKVLSSLAKKTAHSLAMIECRRAETRECVPHGYDSYTSEVNVIHVLNCVPGQEPMLSAIQDQLRILLKPELKIYSVRAFVVLPYSLAKQFFSFII